MTKILTLSVFGKETGKGRPRHMRNGHTYTPAKTVAYENKIRRAFLAKYPNHKPFEGGISLEFRSFFYVPKSWSKKKQAQAYSSLVLPTKKPDFDNIQKTIDALNGLAFVDDCQACDVRFTKRYAEAPNQERLEVYIKELIPNELGIYERGKME